MYLFLGEKKRVNEERGNRLEGHTNLARPLYKGSPRVFLEQTPEKRKPTKEGWARARKESAKIGYRGLIVNSFEGGRNRHRVR